MISMTVIIDFFATGLLLSTFLMMGKTRLVPLLRYYACASFFLACLGLSIGVSEGEPHFYFAPLATLLFKVILIPFIIYCTAKKIPVSHQLRMYIRPATTFFLFAFILILSAIIVRNFPAEMNLSEDLFLFKSLLFISVALILSGILFMVVRKDLFSQLLGLLTMENGIAAFGIAALHDSIPVYLEMGIFFVIIASTVILAVLIDKVHEVYPAGDTAYLNELID